MRLHHGVIGGTMTWTEIECDICVAWATLRRVSIGSDEKLGIAIKMLTSTLTVKGSV